MKAKRPAGMTSKRNPQDATIRNAKASKRRDDALQHQIDALHVLIAALETRVQALERWNSNAVSSE